MKDLLEKLKSLDQSHQTRCPEYGHLVSQEFPHSSSAICLEEMPYLPVIAFKHFNLKSVKDSEVYRVMQSSGTGGKKSKVFLDRITAQSQVRELSSILASEFGKVRVPMLVINDKENPDHEFTASRAAVNGFSIMATKTFAVSASANSETIEVIRQIQLDNPMGKIVIFGFTYNVWEFLRNLEMSKEFDLFPGSIVIHGGGWKRLEANKVSPTEFNSLAIKVLGSERVANYYGLVEQTGTIFLECRLGNMHEPSSGAVIIRNPSDLSPLGQATQGLIQVISPIQESYPGHSILTEDIGYWLPGTECSCGNTRRILKVIGRAKQAEVRGCSDAQLS
jgi:phenylacetate-coenzyme A ligase PaaK-like adenylate-forming protein